MAAVAEAFGLTPTILAVPDGEGLTAALPVFEKRRGPFKAAALPPLVPVVSPLFAEPLREAEMHARRSPFDVLLDPLTTRYAQASLLLHPTLNDVRPLVWGGWSVAPRATYVLGLAGAEDVLGHWSDGPRRTARQHADAYTIVEDRAHAETAVTLMEASYHRHGTDLGLDGEAVRLLAWALADSGHARVFAAISHETDVHEAALIVAHDERTAYYWIAGSLPGPAMTVLLAHVLPRLRDDGLVLFDFMGANVPSIAEFKRRFGARLQPYYHARHIGGRALRTLNRLRG
ncbi:MAG: GNAT family N-acetyltransferase [Rhodothermaceae bacterium]|nr:GNAT family N-acetyltransferase [Rhodothermaceae bacterium]